MMLKGGHGYWATDRYPVGGEFKRAPKEGKAVTKVTREYGCYVHGSNVEVEFADGTHGAVDRTNLSEEEPCAIETTAC